jgi:hypothetical protein
MNDYFGVTEEDSRIDFELNGAKRAWLKVGGKWQKYSDGKMSIKGFYEGSLIFGNRFRNTNYDTLKKLDLIDTTKLIPAPTFIKENLGIILQNNKNFYEELFILEGNKIDTKLNLTEKELGYGRNYINKVFNQKIEEMIIDFESKDFYEREEFLISYYKKKHWLNFNNEYKELTLIRSQFFKQDETKLKKQGLELLNIYTEQQIELIIKKHFKL